ncbi:hypothetical protein KAU33_16065 [Candidatus Dependentiae bacterium]|nr:hypothetical protein [Candidatus Dependentiae bacterium]
MSVEVSTKNKKFFTGVGHIHNPIPVNETEAIEHGNALAASGNYPIGTDECFNVGISGGCGKDCFVYLKGECDESLEIVGELNADETLRHYRLYPNDVQVL